MRIIFVNHVTETEENFYRRESENNQLIFTEVSETTLRGTWEGSFEKKIGE